MMTTPPPGQALTAETVKLLDQDKSVLLHDGEAVTFSHIARDQADYLYVSGPDGEVYAGGTADEFSYVGERDESGWIAWSGGDNPVPGEDVEVCLGARDPEVTGGPADCFEWEWFCEGDGGDITRFRLASQSTAPTRGEVVFTVEHKRRAFDLMRDFAPTPPEPVASALADGEGLEAELVETRKLLVHYASRATQAEARADRLAKALGEIAGIEPKPFDGGLDMAAIRACEECQRYEGHPVQHGICNTHRRPIWDREKHDSHEEKVLGYRAKNIAAEALREPNSGGGE